jgi:hypothetical protein
VTGCESQSVRTALIERSFFLNPRHLTACQTSTASTQAGIARPYIFLDPGHSRQRPSPSLWSAGGALDWQPWLPLARKIRAGSQLKWSISGKLTAPCTSVDPIGPLAAAKPKVGEDAFANISIMCHGCLSNPAMERWCFLQTGSTCPEAYF